MAHTLDEPRKPRTPAGRTEEGNSRDLPIRIRPWRGSAEPSVKPIAEYIHVDSFVHLNFISGGSIRGDRGEVIHERTISDAAARSDIFLVGVNAAF